MQEIDAERRMQILRGEQPTPLAILKNKEDEADQDVRSRGAGRECKMRKRAGENDTDFEMRLASKQTQASDSERHIVLRRPTDAPLTDHAGHIDLFPEEHPNREAKNPEAEREVTKRRKEYEDQYTMHFANAAGFKQGLNDPWYSKKAGNDKSESEPPSKDVWGNEDPRRKQREAARMASNDPLAAMRQGATQVRQVERERKRWKEEKDREMLLMAEEERRRKKRKRHHNVKEDDDLESFSLDNDRKRPREHRARHDRHDGSRRRSHRDDSRDRDSHGRHRRH